MEWLERMKLMARQNEDDEGEMVDLPEGSNSERYRVLSSSSKGSSDLSRPMVGAPRGFEVSFSKILVISKNNGLTPGVAGFFMTGTILPPLRFPFEEPDDEREDASLTEEVEKDLEDVERTENWVVSVPIRRSWLNAGVDCKEASLVE
ncbi:hypothetical protein BGW38_009279 [Lunasporangiospora selenospora]|uniref:Uncharacterized protein n=1 Tax=Lunasporangiospora selenospora TaxID=979761 RepID=A0A9P6FZD9_9FUNG|nr:hypothetical protein BGW38_009279 [Lunasporangiospora selenospora]